METDVNTYDGSEQVHVHRTLLPGFQAQSSSLVIRPTDVPVRTEYLDEMIDDSVRATTGSSEGDEDGLEGPLSRLSVVACCEPCVHSTLYPCRRIVHQAFKPQGFDNRDILRYTVYVWCRRYQPFQYSTFNANATRARACVRACVKWRHEARLCGHPRQAASSRRERCTTCETRRAMRRVRSDDIVLCSSPLHSHRQRDECATPVRLG